MLIHHHQHEPEVRADDPLLEMAGAVWNGGDVDLGALPPELSDLIATGWLRPPIDGALLARSRARTVELREIIRARKRAREAKAERRRRWNPLSRLASS